MASRISHNEMPRWIDFRRAGTPTSSACRRQAAARLNSKSGRSLPDSPSPEAPVQAALEHKCPIPRAQNTPVPRRSSSTSAARVPRRHHEGPGVACRAILHFFDSAAEKSTHHRAIPDGKSPLFGPKLEHKPTRKLAPENGKAAIDNRGAGERAHTRSITSGGLRRRIRHLGYSGPACLPPQASGATSATDWLNVH